MLEKAGFTVDLKLDACQKQLQDTVTIIGIRLKTGGDGSSTSRAMACRSRAATCCALKSRRCTSDAGQDGDGQEPINVVILDACRDSPFARSSRSGSGGLSQVDAPQGCGDQLRQSFAEPSQCGRIVGVNLRPSL